MSKIIKRKIKRSLPAVMIFVLVSSLAAGIVFNFNVSLTQLPKELGSKIKLGLNLPFVEAAKNNATTTVTVRNAPPYFTASPAENPASTSTSPVNEGGSIGFTATMNDDDPAGESGYLIVCSTGAANPVNGGAPTCAATTFCVSAGTAYGVQANCTYNNVTSAAETQPWFAFVCDNNATQADCSLYQQGSGNSGSPLYVNHKPVLNAVSTTVDNKNPSQSVTITATSTDTDNASGWNTIVLNICSTASWSTSTGCAATTLCSATTTLSNGNPTAMSCNYSIPTPTMHGAVTYYTYIKDNYNLGATANGMTGTYNVNNVAPSVGSVTVNGGLDINVSMRGSASSTASSSATLTDNNGCTDLTTGVGGATSTIYMSNAPGGANCTADNNQCYQVAPANCVISNCVGAVASVVCTVPLAYYTDSTDPATGSPRSAYNWLAKITAYDNGSPSLASSTISGTGVEVISLNALDVLENAIPYGTVKSGQNTGTTNATTTIDNIGNTPLNTNVIGTDMNGPAVIGANNQKFNPLANFDYNSAGTTLASTTLQSAAINVNKVTGTDLTSPIYWGIAVPGGRPSGTYSGLNTIQAMVYGGGTW